jgi:type I restriction enzyme M protein
MLRSGSMNMLLHGVENPDITYRDSLAQDHVGEEEKYTLVLANPPFELGMLRLSTLRGLFRLRAFRNSDVHADTTRQD